MPANRDQESVLDIVQAAQGMRDVVSHAYDRINLNIVWNVIENEVPQLFAELQPLISPQ